MNSLILVTSRYTAAGVLIVALFSGAGCSKPSSPASSGGSRPPGAEDAKAFVQSLLPSAIRLSDFKADAPVRQSNSAPDGNVWTVSVKVTLTPAEDLLAAASLEQTKAFYASASDLDALKAWRNIYVRSIYSLAYGAFDTPAVASPARLLIVQQAKSKPLPPIYGKLAAEWQVDHWKWSDVDLELPVVGQPRALFTDGPTLVLGSPEADAVTTAQRKGMDEFRQKQADVESHYAKDLAAATKPGTTYQGEIKHPNGTIPCEVRFVEVPGVADPQTVAFEVRLPQAPAYLFSYTAKLSPKVPLDIPAYFAAERTTVPATSEADAARPVGNLTVHYVRGTGKLATFGNWPGMLASGASRLSSSDRPFVLLGGHFRGLVGDFNGDYTLDSTVTQPTH